VCTELGIKRHVAYRAFDHLEEAELVKVERRRGAAPVVTIQFPKAEAITESIIRVK
jgi:DNA-binding transcriptional regulator YhcF (GntR family)